MKSLIENCKGVSSLRNSESLYHKDVYDTYKSVIIMPQSSGESFSLPGIRDVYYSNISLTINHQYNDSEMSNPLASMLKNIFNSVKTNSYLANDMIERVKSMVNAPALLDTIQSGVSKVANLGLVMASDRVSYFLSTTVSFNLSLTTRYYDESYISDKGNKITTLEFYRILSKRIIGKLVNIKDVLNDLEDAEITDADSNPLLQLQRAPNDYSTTMGGDSSLKDEGTKGAWDILINGKWIYSNLKLNSIKTTFSKELHKTSKCPIYIELDWSFSPSKAWTVNDLNALINAAMVEYSDNAGADGNFKDAKSKAQYTSTPKPK